MVKDSDTFLNLFDNGSFGLHKQLWQLISPLKFDIRFQQVPELLHAIGHAEGIRHFIHYALSVLKSVEAVAHYLR